MKHLYFKDKQLREQEKIDGIKKIILKYLINKKNLSIQQKVFYSYKIFKLSKNTRIRNRCVLTYRGRSVQRKYKLSRHKIRKFISEGYISEFKKAVW